MSETGLGGEGDETTEEFEGIDFVDFFAVTDFLKIFGGFEYLNVFIFGDEEGVADGLEDAVVLLDFFDRL